MAEPRREFERELEAIEAKVIELFAMVAEDLPGATQALLTGNSEMIKALAEREQAIDALYPEIEGMANREILLQAPVASDLRFLLSVLRIVPELERSHDLVVQIATRANHILSDDLSPRCRGLVERMGNLASGMWRQAVDSWRSRGWPTGRSCSRLRSLPTCASCSPCFESCPSSNAPTTSSYRSPPGPTIFSATTSRRAAGGSSSGWGTSHPACGARQWTPGTSAIVPSRPHLPNAITRWTSCTPA